MANVGENTYRRDCDPQSGAVARGMQAELIYRKPLTMMTTTPSQSFHRPGRKENSGKDSRETIHSGHFMVSDFEAEAQDDEDELAVPVPDEEAAKIAIIASTGLLQEKFASSSSNDKTSQQLSIETSLNKLFQCMSLAYRWVSLFPRFFLMNLFSFRFFR